MKKILFTALCLLLIAGSAFAEGTVTQKPFPGGTYYEFFGDDMAVATFTIADDSGSVPSTDFLDPGKINGYYIMTVEVLTSSDDSITILVESALGADLFNKAFTSATSGEIKNADDRWPIYSTPKIDITNMSGDSATVKITFVR